MSKGISSSQVMLGTVEAMFEYLDKIEQELGNIPKNIADVMRSDLGLPRYRFLDKCSERSFFSCGAPVKYVFLGTAQAKKRAEAVALTPKNVPAATVNDPEKCKQTGLCFPNLVRQQFTLCGQDVVVARNASPYSRNHGVVRSAGHEPQSLCFEPFRLNIALSVAQALGAETGSSDYEVWVAGEGFNTQWHFHIQFRKQRGPVWEYVNKLEPRSIASRLEDHPSQPQYFRTNDRSQLLEALYREISPFLPINKSETQTVSVPHRPAMGLLLSYEQAHWKAVLVKSWYPPGKLLFGKQPGLHEHLGEVILESEEDFHNVERDFSAATRALEEQLRDWCKPKELT